MTKPLYLNYIYKCSIVFHSVIKYIFSFSDKEKNSRLEEHMKLQHLEALMGEFLNFSPPDIVLQEATSYFPAKVQKRTPGAMNMVEFKTAVNKVIGTEEYNEYLEKLFQKVRLTTIVYFIEI